MIVVDSSVWIDFFNGKVTQATTALLELMGPEPVLVGDLVLCEVLQGTRTEAHALLVEKELRKFDLVQMLDVDIARAAAYNYRLLRSRGVTVRKTIDMIIGSFCIVHHHALLHADRDFDPMEQHLGLQVVHRGYSVNEVTG